MNAQKIFFKTKKKDAFYKSQFCDDRPVVKALVFEKAFRYKKAKESYQNLISLDPNNADAYAGLGKVLLILGDYPEALKNAQLALKIMQGGRNDTDPELASAYNNVALCYERLGQYKEALPLAEKASKIWERSYGSNHPIISSSYITIGSIFFHLGNVDALKHQKNALGLLLALGDDIDEAGKTTMARILNQLGRTYRNLRRL